MNSFDVSRALHNPFKKENFKRLHLKCFHLRLSCLERRNSCKYVSGILWFLLLQKYTFN